MTMEDGVLVRQCLDGKIDAFEVLISRHKARICRTLYLLLPNHDDVEDVAQEVFIRAYKYLKTFRGDCEFSTWLHTIAINTLRNWTRTHKPSLSLDAMPEDLCPIVDDSVETRLLSLEQSLIVRKALASLPDYYREAIVLRHFHDLSYEEIAKIQQVPLGTVRSRIAKGRQMLFSKLSNMGVMESSERTFIP
jgi:RNA polymerase sigma-70 factor (ECF subfamily)